MKKYILRVIALLLLVSATLPSCSVEYRERHGRHHDNDDHRDRDHEDHDHHYRNY